ncbi:MAG: hypothetical protein EP343_28985 [Deltaproteobacteria bacterium]|nr:MAG: hypothetical protein EP343_28985 [Deltaproteobacteria bacterium]
MFRLLSRCSIVLLVWSLGHTATFAQKSGVTPNVLVLPKGPGSIGGVGENVQPNLNMGLMSYSIPIVVPTGRGDATPSLGISYSSSGGAGLMGIGWSFQGESSITRLTVRGLPTYTNNDSFYAGGELVKISNTPYYRARMEGGFVRYQWIQKDANDQSGYWIAEEPNGTRLYYGADETGKLAPNSQVTGLSGTYAWKLVAQVDRNDNVVRYAYLKEGSQSYLDQISWVFDAQKNPLYQVSLVYEQRPDPISDGKPGFDLQVTKRIKEIKVTAEGKAIRSYKFTFEDATGLSRLIKAEQVGQDETSLYPVVFTMKYSDSTFSPTNSRMVQMPTSLGLNFANNNTAFIDMNGDGLPDVVNTANPKHVFHLNQLTLKNLTQDKHDFPSSQQVENPTVTNAKLSSDSVQLMDFNGDGFTDLVDAVTKRVYLNKGNTRWEPAPESIQNFPITNNDPNVRFFDYNGDKATDIIRSDGNATSYWVNDKKGGWQNVTGKVNIGQGFDKDKLRLIDINGDGLMDVVHITTSSLRYRKYLGYGNWSAWITMTVPGIDQYPLSTKAQFADINGDGMADMVAFLGTSLVYFVNQNGMSFRAGQQLKTFSGIDIPDSSKNSIRIADINGNGSRDIVWIDASGKVTYLEFFGKRPNLMTNIANGIGQHIQVTYGSSVYHYLRDLAANKNWQSKMPMAFTVVNEIQTWASREANKPDPAQACPSTQRIQYHDGYYDGMEKKFRGFRKVESLMAGDESTGCANKSIGLRTETLSFYVGDGNTQAGDNDLYYHGKLREKVTAGATHDGKVITFSSAKLTWTDCKVAGSTTTFKPDVRYICLSAQEQTIQEGETDQAKWKTVRTEYTYDDYGNVTLTANLGEKDKQGDEKYVKSTYITPQDPNYKDKKLWLLRLTQRREVCTAPTGGECAGQDFFYDGPAYQGLPSGQYTKGNLTRAAAKPSANAEAIPSTRNEFDNYGNTVGLQDANGNQSKVEWDTRYHRFPVKNIKLLNGYELSYTIEWDIPYGVVRQSTDWNGQTTRYTYDTFGRLTQIYRPGDPTNKPTDSFQYKLQEPLSQIVSLQRSKAGGDADLTQVTCFDGLGRVIQERFLVEPGKYLVASHTRYNSMGQVAQWARTYTSTNNTCSFTMPTDAKLSENFYDGMGRNIRTQLPDQTSTFRFYKPFQVSSFDAEDRDSSSPHYNTPTIDIVDGLGRLIQRQQQLQPSQAITTQYKWSFLNILGTEQMTSVTDPKGNTKSQTYDLLGRLLKVVDPDRKTITFAYDKAGNLLERKDERGVVLQFTYDALNRTKTIQQQGKPETLVEMTYDKPTPGFPEATYTKGRLSMVSYPGGKDFSSFDVRGNLVVFRRNLLGRNWDFANTYDNVGRLATRKFPDGRELKYQMNLAGRLTAIPGMLSGVTYDSHGDISSWTMANGVKTQLTLDTIGRPTTISVDNGKVVESRFTYDKAGNILQLDRGNNGNLEKRTFTYDALYRLTQAQYGTKETLNYKYDVIGNITQKTSNQGAQSVAHVGDYTYDPKRPRAVSQAGSLTLSYDAAGFMKSDSQCQFAWDHIGRLSETKTPSGDSVRYWYGSLRDRFLKQSQGQHTLYVASDYEVRDGTAMIYVQLGGARLAAWSSTTHGTKLYQDLAPLSGDKPQPDGQINVADAWVYHASRTGIQKLTLDARTPDVDLTQDILQHSVSQLLSASNEGEKHFYHLDHLGSTLAVTDQQGSVIARKSYYPFGAIRESTGNAFSYGYIGTEHSKVTGLNFANARYLHPKLGRWISADPLFDTIQSPYDEWNSYWYSSNNPIRFSNTSGTATESSAEKTIQGLKIAVAALSTVLAVGATVMAYNAAKRSGSRFNKASLVAAGVGLVGSTVSLVAESIPGESVLDGSFAVAGGAGTIFAAVFGLIAAKRDFNQTIVLEDANNDLQNQKSQLSNDLEARKRSLSAERRQLQRKSSLIEQQNQSLRDVRKQSYSNTRRLVQSQMKVSELRAELAALQNQLNAAQADNQRLRRQNSVLRTIASPSGGASGRPRAGSSGAGPLQRSRSLSRFRPKRR